MAADAVIAGPVTDFAAAGDAILRSLPAWFGIESAIVHYVEGLETMPTFTAHVDGAPVGFLAVHTHFPTAAEVHVMAIRAEHHRHGLGRALLRAAEAWLRDQGVRFLQVKTVGPSSDDANYARTREFYLGVGFEPLEEIPTLWDPRNPCLILVKTL